MAQVGSITQTKDNYGLLIMTITGLVGNGNTSQAFQSQGYPFGSFEAVFTAGTPTGDTITLQGSNDGVNFVNTTQVITMTAAGTGLAALAVSGLDAPARFYQFVLGGTGSGTYTITAVLMGTRG